MRLVRYGSFGAERPGILDSDDCIRDLSSHIPDITGDCLDDASLSRLRSLDISTLPKVDSSVRLGSCVGSIGKFMCIGLNYMDHAAETGADIPEHPVLFMKATSAIVGAYDDVYLPRGSVKSDWEVELGVVIGKPAKYVRSCDALDYVAGYCVVNDISERSYQKELSGQWTKGKSCDTFGPMGPWLLTRDEVPDPQNLSLHLDLNGERQQTGTTSQMIFDVCTIIEHLSSLFTLHSGDVISTGTPSGVGAGIRPSPRFLQSGDVIELGISGLGIQRQRVYEDS